METKTINLLGIRNKAILAHFNEGRFAECVVMEALTPEGEKHIDNTETFNVHNATTISKKDIYFYGDIDLNSRYDVNLIINKKLINEDSVIRSDFDYEKGCHYIYDRLKQSITNDPLLWFKYNYCLIGKPDKIVVYKLPIQYLRS